MKHDIFARVVAVVLWLPAAVAGGMAVHRILDVNAHPFLVGGTLLLAYAIMMTLAAALYAATRKFIDNLFKGSDGDPYVRMLRKQALLDERSSQGRQWWLNRTVGWKPSESAPSPRLLAKEDDLLSALWIEALREQLGIPEKTPLDELEELLDSLIAIEGAEPDVECVEWTSSAAYVPLVLQDEQNRTRLGSAGRLAQDVFTKSYARSSVQCPA